MKIITIGSIMTALAVILGAFGTHGLKGKVAYDLLQIYETGTYYLMIHAIGTLIYGLWFRIVTSQTSLPKIRIWPVQFFWAGCLIFTGSLYAITFTGIRGFGMITPIGGLLFILGWIGFAIQAARK